MNESQEDIDILIMEFLENKLSEKELRHFFEWVCADKKNEKYFFDLKAIHDSRSNFSVDINESWCRLEIKLQQKQEDMQKKKHFIIRCISSVAAIFIFLVGLSLGILFQMDLGRRSRKFILILQEVLRVKFIYRMVLV